MAFYIFLVPQNHENIALTLTKGCYNSYFSLPKQAVEEMILWKCNVNISYYTIKIRFQTFTVFLMSAQMVWRDRMKY